MERLVRIKELTATLNISRSSIYKLERACKFPQKINITDHMVAFKESEVEEYLKLGPAAWGDKYTKKLLAEKAKRLAA